MKKSSFLALALAPMILGAPMAVEAQSVTTDPVGFVKLSLEPGLQTVGLTMLESAVVAGSVASNNGTSITLSGTQTVESLLQAGTDYYVEVASGATWEGERFEIDVAGSSGSTLAVAASARNTVDLSSVDLTNHSVRVRPHNVLGDSFPASELQAGSNAGNSDNVLVYNQASGAFDTYWLQADPFGGASSWRKIGGGSASFNDLVVAPGQGMFYRRAGAAVELLTNIGEVRTNHFRQPLAAGLNQVSEGHPVDNSPATRLLVEGNGFQSGSNAGNSDNLLVYNASTGGFDTYWYQADPFGGASAWRKVGSGSTDFTNAKIMSADGSIFVRKISADTNYEAPVTF